MTETAVLVTSHARRRARERCGIGVGLAAWEVASAIAAGRMAVHEPAFTALGSRRRADRTKAGGGRGRLRWVWPPEETRAYLIRQKAGRWIVVTVVTADQPAAAAA